MCPSLPQARRCRIDNPYEVWDTAETTIRNKLAEYNRAYQEQNREKVREMNRRNQRRRREEQRIAKQEIDKRGN